MYTARMSARRPENTTGRLHTAATAFPPAAAKLPAPTRPAAYSQPRIVEITVPDFRSVTRSNGCSASRRPSSATWRSCRAACALSSTAFAVRAGSPGDHDSVRSRPGASNHISGTSARTADNPTAAENGKNASGHRSGRPVARFGGQTRPEPAAGSDSTSGPGTRSDHHQRRERERKTDRHFCSCARSA